MAQFRQGRSFASALFLGGLLVACWDSASLHEIEPALAPPDAAVEASRGDASAEVPFPEAGVCPPPLSVCGPVCTNVLEDPFNCGQCGNSCAQPPAPTCNGQVSTVFGPGTCSAGSCAFPSQAIDCTAEGRSCAGGICGPCLTGLQDNDLNGSCLPACDPTTCQNDGLCSDTSGTATCACLPGFTGPTCAVNIDDCTPNPCLNGATCVDGVLSHTCTCLPEFTGASCETLIPTFLWVDATDLTTLTVDGSNHVTEWRDKSGLGRDATVPAGGTAPILAAGTVNGQPAIDFDGDTVRLQTAAVTTSAEMTIFVVFNMVNPQKWGSLINQSQDTYFSLRRTDVDNLNFHIQNDDAAPLQPISLNTWKVVTAIRENDVSTLYYDQASATSFTGDTLTGGDSAPITLGNAMALAESMGGFIAEVRAFSSALPLATRATIEAQLKAKYAIP